MGAPDRMTADRLCQRWEAIYPNKDTRVNQSLCELLVYLGSSNVVRRTIPLLASAPSQEEKFHYLFTLRSVTNGWSLDDRRVYFNWLGRARTEFVSANTLPTALNYIRGDAEATLSPAERASLSDVLASVRKPAVSAISAPTNAPRAFVKAWSMTDLEPLFAPTNARRNLTRGKQLFTEIGCAQCHRFGAEGALIGPDLTAVSARFDRRALLESIVEPSRVVAENYRTVTVAMKSGAIYDGRIVSEDANSVTVAINPVDPDRHRRLLRTDIASQRVSDISPMPPALLDTLTREEIADLLAWIESGAATGK
jgi:putative heme-binding domain-containing protein